MVSCAKPTAGGVKAGSETLLATGSPAHKLPQMNPAHSNRLIIKSVLLFCWEDKILKHFTSPSWWRESAHVREWVIPWNDENKTGLYLSWLRNLASTSLAFSSSVSCIAMETFERWGACTRITPWGTSACKAIMTLEQSWQQLEHVTLYNALYGKCA